MKEVYNKATVVQYAWKLDFTSVIYMSKNYTCNFFIELTPGLSSVRILSHKDSIQFVLFVNISSFSVQ